MITLPDGVLFSNVRCPDIGERIHVIMNDFGWAEVVSYKDYAGTDDTFRALVVQFENPPAWYIKQNQGNVLGVVFGQEIDLEE